MRVAFFSWESLHSIAVGGLAAHVTELAQALTDQGHEVHVFTRIGPGQCPDQTIDGVTYHRCAYRPASDLISESENMSRALVDRFNSVERESGGFDVVHAHDWLTSGTLAWSTTGGHRQRVFTLHSTEYGRCGNSHCGGCSRAIRDREWEGTFNADRVITVSHHLKEEVREIYRVPEDKMCVIYNGVDVHRFDIPVDVGAVKERYGLGRMDPTILFCGRMAWQKGPDILLEAVPHLLRYYNNLKVLMVGDGDMRWGLEERARQLRVEHALRFLGHRRDRELIELFKIADTVCVPSRNEPFGIVILEAWSAGKPVVVTRNGGPHEFVRHGIDGYTVSDNPDSVGWGLGTIFKDFDQARWMGSNGRLAAQKRFDWHAIARQAERAYRH